MHSWNALSDFLVGSWVEVAILGMSSGLNRRRARMSEAFIFVVGKKLECLGSKLGRHWGVVSNGINLPRKI